MENESYREFILQWRKERDESIRQENSWLALCGLYWLKVGKNKFGSSPECEVHLPERAPAEAGYLDFNGKFVVMRVNPGQEVFVNGQPAAEKTVMQTDQAETPTFANLMDIQFVIIHRGARFGARIWDNQRAARKTFPPRSWYEIDERFRIPAQYSPYDRPKMAYFPDVTGEKAEFPVEGYLTFEFGGKRYKLDVNREEDDSLFVRFWDPTAREETYPTGRYLSAEREKDGTYYLDFNMAYSPPCAFTDFATCVFAPEQNRLDFKITAGERYEKH